LGPLKTTFIVDRNWECYQNTSDVLRHDVDSSKFTYSFFPSEPVEHKEPVAPAPLIAANSRLAKACQLGFIGKPIKPSEVKNEHAATSRKPRHSPY